MRRVVAIAALLLASLAALTPRLGAASDNERYLQGLRDRRQFELAEKYCDDRLADSQLPDAQRVELTIELSRSWADHALESPPAAQGPLWEKSRKVIDQFATNHPRHPQLVLIRAQGALAALAQGEVAREDAEPGGGNPSAFETARGVLRGAIAQLRGLDAEVAAELQRRARTVRADNDAALSVAQLLSLEVHLQYQLARALRNQALCYPPGSSDRINSLSQALELLAALARQNLEALLAWSARLDEIACRRLLEDYGTAERKLSQLEKTAPPAAMAPLLRAERIRLALARGQIDEALSEAGHAAALHQANSAQADCARLEAYLSAWQRAVQRHNAQDAAEWEKTALDQVRTIEQTQGPSWVRKADTLLARWMAQSAGSESAAALVRAAQSLYRSGRIDEALSTYDQAARRAREQHDADQALAIAYTAATIEKEREHHRAAIDRYRKLAIITPADPQAAEAHLLAVYSAAQLAAGQHPPQLDEYERLLREHVSTWPKSQTASQAWWWLGRLEEHQHVFREAIKALRNVKADQPQYPAAVEAAGRCYTALLAQLRRDGKSTAPLAKDAVHYFEQVIAEAPRAAKKSPAEARVAAMAAARICLMEIPNGAAQAESLLNTALGGATEAPPEWQIGARTLLVATLAAQGRISEAEELFKKIPFGNATDALALVNTLAEVARRASGDRKQELAELQLRAVDDLLAKREELDAATLETVSRVRATTLAETGRRREAIAELESLAESNPHDGQTQEELASLLMAGGDASDLKAALAKWREITTKCRPGSPRWFRAHYSLARAQLDLGDAAQACSTVRLIESRHPDLGGPEMKFQFQQLLAECDRRATSRGAQKK